jgi:hypothetical protein
MMRYLTLFLAILPFFTIQAADYFWVGDSGDWSDAANHWATSSGGAIFHASPPGPDDDVFFDANSFSSGGQTVNVDLSTATCLSMDWTGATDNPELLITTNAKLDIYGNLVLIAAMDVTFAFQFGSRIRMQSDNIGNTITSAGQDLVNLRFEGAGEWTLQDGLISSSELFISNGSLVSNGQTIKAFTFSVNGSSSSLNLDNSDFTATTFRIVSASSATFVNSTISATTVEISPVGIAFNDLQLSGSSPSLSGTGLSFETLELSGTTQTTVNGSHTINTLLSATEAGSLIELQAGSTLTLNGSMQSLGASCAGLITWRSSNSGSAATLSKNGGSIDIDFVILQDIHASGSATFTADNSVGLGNTNGWTINASPSQTYFWIADNGGNWSNANNWSLSSGGVSAGCIPTPVDNVIFDVNSFNTAIGQPIVVVDDNLQQAHDMTWTGVLNIPILRIPVLSQLELYGNLSLSPAMTLDFVASASSQLWLKASDAVTIDPAGQDLVNFRMDGAGTYQLLGPLTSSHEIFLLEGTFDLDGFDLDGRVIFVNGSNATLDISNSTVTASSRFQINSISSLLTANSILSANEIAILPPGLMLDDIVINGSGGSLSGSNLTMGSLLITSDGLTTINGSHTINGELFLDNPGGEVEIQSGAEISMGDFKSSGNSCGDQIFLRSSNGGSFFTFLFTGGTPPPPANISFLILQDSRVLNGPFETNESVDLGNTTGWVINSASSQQYHWVGGSGDWDDPAHWSLTSGGGSSGCLPTVNDDVIFDDQSFMAPGQEVVIPSGTHYCRTMEWIDSGPDAVANQPTLRLASLANLYVHGSLLMADAGQMSYAVDAVFGSKIFMASRAAGGQVRSGGLDLINFRFEGTGGEWALLDDLTASTELFLTRGTLDTDGQNLNGSLFIMSSTGVSLLLRASEVNIESIRFNSLNVDAGTSLLITNDLSVLPSGLTLYDVQLTGADAALSGANLTLNDLQLSGPGQNAVGGNMLVQGDLVLDAPGSTVSFQSGNTLEVQGDISSSAFMGSPISLQSSSAGVTAMLVKTAGSACLEYLNIQDIAASGGAVFAAVNSTDGGNNSGWIFSPAPSCEIFLPVECTDFQAAALEGPQVVLRWMTAQEVNNAGFEIQRSSDGTSFETIAWVKGAGNSNQSLSYHFIDDSLLGRGSRIYYYRLLQQDLDGTIVQACDVISVRLAAHPSAPPILYPNPATTFVNLLWEQSSDGPVTITIYDALGRIWRKETLEYAGGNSPAMMEVSGWPEGYYRLQILLPRGEVWSGALVVRR